MEQILFVFFTRRNILILLALILGLFFPSSPNDLIKEFVLAVVSLLVVMYLLSVKIKVNITTRFFWLSSLLGISLSYVLLGNVLIWSSAKMFYSYANVWTGFVVLAVAPPVFSELLSPKMFKGRVPFPLLKTLGAYIAAVIIVPFMFSVLVDPGLIDIKKVILATLAVVLLPLLISRLIMVKGQVRKLVEGSKDYCIDICFFLITFAIISANAGTINSLHQVLLPIVITILFSTFVLGKILASVCSFFHIQEETTMSTILIGTLKDGFIAGGVALYLFPPESALPAAFYCLIFIFYGLWLQKQAQRNNQG